MRRHRRLLLLVPLTALALTGASWLIWRLAPDRVEAVVERLGPAQDRAAFERWLAADPANREAFARFEGYLTEKGVVGVVPVWQLTRSDSGLAASCAGGAFVIPPEELWHNAVPVLRFVEAGIVPRIGRVEAISAWRSPQANRCSNGATRSKHLTFAGIDFVAEQKLAPRELFTRLCAIQAELGAKSRFGLGAYFDPVEPGRNTKGRFHVDLAGYRSWGFGYRGQSSGCGKL